MGDVRGKKKKSYKATCENGEILEILLPSRSKTRNLWNLMTVFKNSSVFKLEIVGLFFPLAILRIRRERGFWEHSDFVRVKKQNKTLIV